MKKIVSSLFVGLSVTVCFAFLFSACSKADTTGATVNSTASLMAFNLAPDKTNGIVITNSNNVVGTAAISYPGYTGSYLSIYTGAGKIQAYDAINSSVALTSTDFSFTINKYYSVFVLGTSPNYRNVITQDNIDSLSATSGQAYVRYINAIPDSSSTIVTLAANGGTASAATTKYASISSFAAVAPGQLVVTMTNGSTIQASRTITVVAKGVYTILLVGSPGSTASPVQVSYVQNGSL